MIIFILEVTSNWRVTAHWSLLTKYGCGYTLKLLSKVNINEELVTQLTEVPSIPNLCSLQVLKTDFYGDSSVNPAQHFYIVSYLGNMSVPPS